MKWFARFSTIFHKELNETLIWSLSRFQIEEIIIKRNHFQFSMDTKSCKKSPKRRILKFFKIISKVKILHNKFDFLN